MITCIEKINLWNNGYIELWDFSKSNETQENREEAASLVSSACYGKQIANKKEHFYRLLKENGGGASEVLGFIPFKEEIPLESFFKSDINNYLRYGYYSDGVFYTNLRNAYNYYENLNNTYCITDNDMDGFVVMRIKIPQMILLHQDRHKMFERFWSQNWQSNRRYHSIEYFENEEVFVDLINNIPVSKEKKCR